ncbi:hypothetical protein LSH36_294g01036 [Paralvinella palmiformis]|uniref:RING-type domain-containing protein n=1 Tax=Paralvinella palmiformis TaxID=53620 RepID=A0AAD9JIB7_9ANNE|nr:hypothetical protein LSH36_294g01036 [Paralvinella palmiformis]
MNSPMMNHIEDELICCVCLDLLDNPVILPCSHNLCKKCVQGLIDNRNARWQSFDCPKCRHRVTLSLGESIEGLPENKALRNIISIVKEEQSLIGGATSQCSKHSLGQHHYCLTCKCAICDKCKAELHNGFGHNVEMIDVVLADKQEKTANSVIELKSKQKCLEDQHKQILDEKEKLKVYVDSQLESVDFRFDQLDYQIRLTKKMLTSSLQSSIRERKRMINSEEASCQQKISHIKSLIKQYEASQASYKEPEYKVKVMDNCLLGMCSLMTFELNDHKYEFSEEPLPDVRLEGVDAVIKGLNSVKWHCNVESTEDKQQERCSDGKQQQQATTASVSGNFEKRGNNYEYVLVPLGMVAMTWIRSLFYDIVKQIGRMLGNLCVKSPLNVGESSDGASPSSITSNTASGTSHPSTRHSNKSCDHGDISNQGHQSSARVVCVPNPPNCATGSPFHVTDFFKSFSDPGTSQHSVGQSAGASAAQATPLATPESSTVIGQAESRSKNPSGLQSSFSVDSPSQKPLFTLGTSPPMPRMQRKFRNKLQKRH